MKSRAVISGAFASQPQPGTTKNNIATERDAAYPLSERCGRARLWDEAIMVRLRPTGLYGFRRKNRADIPGAPGMPGAPWPGTRH